MKNYVEWEYQQITGYAPILTAAHEALKADLAAATWDTSVHSPDTRQTHGRLFGGLTPPLHQYFAGNYRGAHFDQLRRRPVHFGKNGSRKGTDPVFVQKRMDELAERVRGVLRSLDAVHADAALPVDEKFALAVTAIAELFCPFLLIHPYANGNGHIARFLVAALLQHYGYKPRAWTIDPRPATNPDYLAMIDEADSGNLAPLVGFFLRDFYIIQPLPVSVEETVVTPPRAPEPGAKAPSTRPSRAK